ncbi:hypothetical protein QYM36_001914 [Artemia franciscana]|uniref:Uncharacterized protein n=1 Tax=Artemia franciscana TaxID=6661 RepID=A0AA88L9I3_ARTSF|nr:hypothetical protein QYM36_001914 [Artemia franciscana]
MATRTILPNDPSISFPDEKDFAFFSSENWARDCITLAKKTSIPPRSMVLLDCSARSMGQELPVGATVLFTPAKGDAILAAYTNSENTSKIEEQIDKVKLDHLDKKLKEKLRRLLEIYGRIFAQSKYDVGQSNIMEAEIDINPDVPIHKVKKKSLHQSPVFIIAKPVNGVNPERSQLDVTNSRFLIDVRNVNQAIRRSAWPVTREDDIFSTLGLCGARFISIIDV